MQDHCASDGPSNLLPSRTAGSQRRLRRDLARTDGGQKPRPSQVDPFKPYLARRIGEGCFNASTLHREITAQGFSGSYPIVRRLVEQYRNRPDLTRVPRSPSVRQVTGWICRHPDNLIDRDTEQLGRILNR